MRGSNVVAIYMRISDDDNDVNKSESNSISNQRKLIINYISKKDFLSNSLNVEYIDDGYSGVNFERPGFKKMLEDARHGSMNIIIVKDLSRLGRNHIETGNLIENIFPFLNVRFISINDNYDSFNKSTFNIVETGFRNLIYELYSKDLSLKIKKSKELIAKKGMFSAPLPPFGYKKAEGNPHKLEVDMLSEKIVKRIFNLCIDGYKAQQIAKILNKENIPTPIEYIKKKDGTSRKTFWNDNVIRRIISNEVYIGHTISRKKFSDGVRKSYKKNLNEKLIIVKNTHKPIVSKEIFEKANIIFKKQIKSNYTKNSSIVYVKKIKCLNCGHYMYYKGCKNRYYYCHTTKLVDNCSCIRKNIFENNINNLIYEILLIFRAFLNSEELIYKYKEYTKSALTQNYMEMKKNKRELVKLNNKKIKLFEDYSLNKLTQEEYFSEVNKLNNYINKQIEKDKMKKVVEKNTDFDFFAQLSNELIINKKIVDLLINSILVAKNGEIQVDFNFKDLYYLNEDLKTNESKKLLDVL